MTVTVSILGLVGLFVLGVSVGAVIGFLGCALCTAGRSPNDRDDPEELGGVTRIGPRPTPYTRARDKNQPPRGTT